MTTVSKYQFDRRDILFILVIFILAMALRIFYFNDYKEANIYPVLTHSDSYSYYLWAKDIASGTLLGNKAFMKWPLYAYFLGFLFKIFGENLSTIYLLQSVLGTINCLFVYLIAKIIFNQKVGFIAALLYLWYGLFIFYEGLLMYTSLSLFLNLILFLFILRIKDNPNKKRLFWLGIFLGICTITQANIVIFGILAAVWILAVKKLNWRGFVYNFSCFILGLCIVIGATTLINYLAEKDFVLIAGNLGLNFYLGNNERASGTFSCPVYVTPNQEDMFRDSRIIARVETGRDLKTSEVSNFWFKKAVEFIRKHPRSYLNLIFKKIAYATSPEEFVHDMEYYYMDNKISIFKIMFMDLRFIFPFGLLGMFLGLKKFKDTVFLYIVLLAVLFSISLFFVAARYRIVMVPFLMIFAAFGIFSIWDTLKNRSFWRFGLLCLSVVAIFVLFNHDRIFARNIDTNSKRYSHASDEHLFKALYYENNYDYQKAVQEINAALAIIPNDQRALFRLGLIYYRMDNLKAAEENFKEVVKINPLCVDAYYNLGFMYNKQKHFSEALNVLSKALFLESDNIGMHFELGVAYKATGEIEKAKGEFSFALKNLSRWRRKDREIIEKELADLDKRH